MLVSYCGLAIYCKIKIICLFGYLSQDTKQKSCLLTAAIHCDHQHKYATNMEIVNLNKNNKLHCFDLFFQQRSGSSTVLKVHNFTVSVCLLRDALHGWLLPLAPGLRCPLLTPSNKKSSSVLLAVHPKLKHITKLRPQPEGD